MKAQPIQKMQFPLGLIGKGKYVTAVPISEGAKVADHVRVITAERLAAAMTEGSMTREYKRTRKV